MFEARSNDPAKSHLYLCHRFFLFSIILCTTGSLAWIKLAEQCRYFLHGDLLSVQLQL